MKKYLSIILVIIIAVAMLAGCGGSGGDDPAQDVSGDAPKTFGDIEKLEPEEYSCGQYPDGNIIIYAYKSGDRYYRASSEVEQEKFQALWDLEFDDPEYDAKYQEIMDSIEIQDLEDLTDQILSPDELAALAGKTGQELIDEGWTVNGSYYLDDMGFWLNFGPFVYNVHFDADPATVNTETFDPEEGILDWVVTGAEFVGLGDSASDPQ